MRNDLPQPIHPSTRSAEKELIGHLRSQRRIRRSQHSHVRGQARGQIVNALSIRERPAEIADRAIPGHWEGDLVGGTKNSHIATLVERHSRFTALVKVRSKDTAAAPRPRAIATIPHRVNIHDGFFFRSGSRMEASQVLVELGFTSTSVSYDEQRERRTVCRVWFCAKINLKSEIAA
jgi:hypothetical protein